MKKSLLTLSMVALFTIAANAQDDKKAPFEKTPAKKEVVNPDGTTTIVNESTTNNQPGKSQEPKKSGTRMAINQKGTNGTKSTSSKEEVKTTNENTASPTSKPH